MSARISAVRALTHKLKSVDYAAVKEIKFTFDPFSTTCKSIREVMFNFHSSKYTKTNVNAVLKVDVKSDRTNPKMEVLFSDNQKALFKTENLSSVDIVDTFNDLCNQRVTAKKQKK